MSDSSRVAADVAARRRVGLVVGGLFVLGLAATVAADPSPGKVLAAVLISAPFFVLVVRQSVRDLGLLALQCAAFFVFCVLRWFADDLGGPLVVGFPQAVDRAIGLGELPTLRLQRALYTDGVTWLERATAAGYGLHGVVLWVVGGVLLLRRPAEYPRLVAASVLALFAALPVHFLWPTAPPWYAVPEVSRLLRDVALTVDPAAYAYGVNLNGNDVAAMPSLHMAVAWLALLAVWSHGRAWRVLGVVYVLTVLWAIVYGGEHYVADALGGIALAWGAWRVADRLAARDAVRLPVRVPLRRAA